ncbi:MAG: hypothetical protein IJX08_06820, partial [Clostridia bacterium]|nr:hypothetical protein [Clostridia bacterium]
AEGMDGESGALLLSEEVKEKPGEGAGRTEEPCTEFAVLSGAGEEPRVGGAIESAGEAQAFKSKRADRSNQNSFFIYKNGRTVLLF